MFLEQQASVRWHMINVLSCVLSIPIVYSDDLIGFRIFGGDDAEENEFPSHVYIRVHLFSAIKKRTARRYCGGTIISDKWILTSGHCINDTGRIFVGSGSSNRTKAKYQEAKRAIPHEELQFQGRHSNQAENDIGLIELESPLEIDGISTAVMKLPEHETTSYGKGIIVIGWGRNTYEPVNPGQESPKILQKLLVNIFPCPDGNRDVICIASPEGTGVCDGDSGGPLLINGEIYGVASYVENSNPDPNLDPNKHCTDVDTWAAYMSVPKYRQWIRDHSGV